MERNKLGERSIISPLAIKQSLLKRGPNSSKRSTSQTYRSRSLVSKKKKNKPRMQLYAVGGNNPNRHAVCSSNFLLPINSRTCLRTTHALVGSGTWHCTAADYDDQTWLRPPARPSQRESLVQPPVKDSTSFTWLRKLTHHTFLHRWREQLQVYYNLQSVSNYTTYNPFHIIDHFGISRCIIFTSHLLDI